MKNPFRFESLGWLPVIIVSFQLFYCPLWGLNPDQTVDQYLVNQWQESDGIPLNSIYSITQTPDGYLWIATAMGLIRFDGIKFQREIIYPLENAIPISLFVDRDGVLWIGSTEGLTSYRCETGQSKTFTAADGITADAIRRIKEDMRGDLWISFKSSYVNRFSKGKFFVFDASHGLAGKRINAIVEDQNGLLLFGSRENGVFVYKEGRFHKYPISGLEKLQIITMYESRKGDLWIGTNNGLFRKTGKTTGKYTTLDGLSDSNITYILEDSERNLWVGTRKGLNLIREKQDGTIDFERLLEPYLIVCLFEDREKNLWVGTYRSGIKQLKKGKFISYAPLEIDRDESLCSLFEVKEGDTWIGTVSGKLYHFRGSDLIELINPPHLSGISIISIAEDSGKNLWIGTNGKGVFQRKNGTFIQYTTREGLGDNLVTSIYRDSRDNLWFSTFDGVSVRRSNTGAMEYFKSRNGLLGRTVHNVYEDKSHNIWIAADKGITVFKNGKLTKENTTYYLQDVSVTCIHEDISPVEDEDRVFWIASHGAGLKRLSLNNGTIISYTAAEGITSNILYQILEDQQGNLWLTSDSGILRVSKSELNRFTKGEVDEFNCTTFGISDGMKSSEFDNVFSGNSVLKTRNGELWFITKKGISIVNPSKIRINKLPPPVVIEKVTLDNHSITLHQQEEAYTYKGKRDIKFQFTAPTFLSPEKIRFKYQLLGYDRAEKSLPPGSERVAWYKDLPPGTYTFRVTACNAEGIWNRTGDSFTFSLKPFFYQTLLFKIAALLLFIALAVAAFYIYKKKKQSFKKKAKYKASPLNPIFAGECITKLKYLMEIEKVYLDADISLQSLAEKMSIPPHQLSQLLNEKLDRNFADFINWYRIEDAKKILQTPKGARRKISSIAIEVGFSTMAAFYKTFKKHTNMTPTKYKKEVES